MSSYMANECDFSANLKMSELSVESRKWSASEFQAIGQTTKISDDRTCCDDVAGQSIDGGCRTKPLTTGNMRHWFTAARKVFTGKPDDIGGLRTISGLKN